uniref:Candidate secreted effector n=1 Tax=Meloidogyne incognita TaxID=6306 RepID=A0A914NTG7_MELIC
MLLRPKLPSDSELLYSKIFSSSSSSSSKNKKDLLPNQQQLPLLPPLAVDTCSSDGLLIKEENIQQLNSNDNNKPPKETTQNISLPVGTATYCQSQQSQLLFSTNIFSTFTVPTTPSKTFFSNKNALLYFFLSFIITTKTTSSIF